MGLGVARSFIDMGHCKVGKDIVTCPFAAGSNDVKANGLSVVKFLGSMLGGDGNVFPASTKVKVNGVPIAKFGDPTTYGIVISGSSNVKAG